MLYVGVCARAWCLAVSFETTVGVSSGFHLFFLTPLIITGAALVWEIARSAENQTARKAAVAAPMLLWLVAFPGAGDSLVRERYIEMISSTICGPTMMVCVCLLAFYLITWCCGEKLSEIGAMFCAGPLAFIGPRTVDTNTFVDPHWPVLALIAAIQIVQSVKLNQSWRLAAVVGAVMAVANISAVTPQWLANELVHCRWHLAALAVLLMGVVYRDTFANFLKEESFVIVPATAIVFLVTHEPFFYAIRPESMLVLLSATIVAAIVYWRIERNVEGLFAVLLCAATLGGIIRPAVVLGAGEFASWRRPALPGRRTGLVGGRSVGEFLQGRRVGKILAGDGEHQSSI